jgi:hypothetical protein
MIKMPKPAITAINEDESNIVEILKRLRSGEPLGALDKYGIIRNPESELLKYIKQTVIQSRKQGCACARDTIWMEAQRGGGKTEMMELLNRELLSETYIENHKKSIIVSIDLKETTEASTGPGLQAIIFKKAITTNSSQIKQQLEALVDYLTGRSQQSEKTYANLISLGIDIALTFAKTAVPGASLLGTTLISDFRRRYHLRGRKIESLLRCEGIVSADAINLLKKWIKYSTKPNQKTWEEFEKAFQPLADREVLFPILCSYLQSTGYSTIVLLCDEVDRLVGSTSLTQAFERLWDPPKNISIHSHNMNIYFVLAGTKLVENLTNQSRYAGFVRRFLGTEALPANRFHLPSPIVKLDPDANDDLAHARDIVKSLCNKLTNAVISTVSRSKEGKIRRELYNKSEKYELTWHDLWAIICEVYDP